MENTVDRLEAMFQKADSDLNNLSQRLKFEFETDEDLQQCNPGELIQKIGEVKKEYASLVQQAADIQEAQKEAMTEFRGHLNDICNLLLTLQSNPGAQLCDKPEELSRLEQFLGSELPWGTSADDSIATTDVTAISSEESPRKDDTINNLCSTQVSAGSIESEISAVDKRKATSEFVEVDQQEFESVSSLIRGRVKLSEVNSTYRILWDHYKTCKDGDKLAVDEMHKMGLKVSGVTGQAKLKVLRALKLIKLSTKGEVTSVE